MIENNRISCARFVLFSACVLLAACSSESVPEEPCVVSYLPQGAFVTTRATSLQWNTQVLEVSYNIRNEGDDDIILFDAPVHGKAAPLRQNRTVDGFLIYRGKLSSADLSMESFSSVGGRLLLPGQYAEGTGTIELPLSINGGTRSEYPDIVDFCIGYGMAGDTLPTQLGDGTYPDNAFLEQQLFSCQRLDRPQD